MTRHRRTLRDERRSRAEARLALVEPRSPEPAEETSRLLHELHVHQVEFEMQNEELRSARGQIEAALQRYRELFDFAPIGYAVLDEHGTILDANLEFARLVGRPRSKLDGFTFFMFVEAAQIHAIHAFLHERLHAEPGEPGASLEVVLPRKGAEGVTLRLVASAHAGKPGTVLVALHDITASKRAEVAREEIARKDEFMAALSHELRNPLFPISTNLSLLGRVEPGSPRAREAIATIERQVRHLAHIVDDLLEVSRITRGKIDLRRERLELAPLVEQVVADHLGEFEERGVTLESELGAEPLWVDADATRIVQVIGNLLMNASKFTPEGGRVHVRLGRAGNQAVLSVRDTGVGIDPDVRSRLFVPFT